jgi:hypothetical protein
MSVAAILRKRTKRHLWPILVAGVGVACAAAAGSAGGAAQSSHATALSFKLEHFLCYSMTSSGFQARTVVVRDQFKQRRKMRLTVPGPLCNVASKNGSRIFDRRRHLLCYTARSSGRFRSRQVVVTNQFGKTKLALSAPKALCVPSAKSLTTKPAEQPKGLDHFQCYPVQLLSTVRLRRVIVADEFGKHKYVVRRPLNLCNPASKNGSNISNPRDHLLCYVFDQIRGFEPRRALVTNQFGDLPVVALIPKLLCLPSLKRLLPPRLPDLTVKIDPASFGQSCPGGTGTCVTTFAFTVMNVGAGASGAFDVLATADPGQTTTLSVAGLAPGASATRTASLGPDGDCFDPNCTVSVTVDSGNVVTETNESNNTDSVTAPP